MPRNSRFGAILIAAGGLLIVFTFLIISRKENSGRVVEDAGVPEEAAAQMPAEAVESAEPSTLSQEDLQFIDWIELPSVEDVVSSSEHTTEASAQAAENAILNGLKAESLEEACEYYQDYIDRYPLTPDATVMRNRLGGTLARLGRFDEARQVLHGAAMLAGDGRFTNVITINLANLETRAGNLELAEQMLNRLRAKPIPETIGDPYDLFPQAFEAPRFLAEVYRARNQMEDADAVLREAGKLALTLTRENPDIEWLPSYAANAFLKRITLVLDSNSPDPDVAMSIADEFKREMPDYNGPLGYGDMVRSINRWKRMEEFNATK